MRFMKIPSISTTSNPAPIAGSDLQKRSSHGHLRTADRNNVTDHSSFLYVIPSHVSVLLPLGVIDIDCIGRIRLIDYITMDN